MRLASIAASLTVTMFSLGGCAALSGMVAGSPEWFKNGHEADLKARAATDLSCSDKPIEFVSTAGDDYREVEARGCGKKVGYTYFKVGPAGSWAKSEEPAP